MNVVEKQSDKIFGKIKHIDREGNEYWRARELQRILEYKEWRKFENVITKAKSACEKSDLFVYDHFVYADKMVEVGSKTIRKIVDYKLSRYACYLIAQNADSRKKVIVLAQTYFAIQTRKMEIMESEYSKLTEDEKRLYQRSLTRRVIIH